MKIRFLLAVLAAAFVTGCNSGGSGGAASATETSKLAPITVAFVTNGPGDFWTIAENGTKKAASELNNVTVEFKIPQDNSAAAQRSTINDLVVSGVKGIAVSPLDPENQTDFLNKIAGQVLLITQDSDAPHSNRACYVGTDNFECGRQVGEQLKKVLPNGGKYMMFVGNTDAQNAVGRINGVKAALSDPKYQLIGIRTDDADRARAKQNAADAIVAYPDLKAEVGLWGSNGPMCYSAVKEAHKQGQIKIVCTDEEDDTIAGIRDDTISATIVQHPFQFGYLAVKLMASVLRKDGSMTIPTNKQIIVPVRVINKSNVDDFMKLLNVERGRAK